MFHLLGYSINSQFSIPGCLLFNWLFKNSQFSILGCLQLGGDVVALQLPLADHKVEVLQLLLGDGDRRRDPLVFHLGVTGLFKSSLNKKEFWEGIQEVSQLLHPFVDPFHNMTRWNRHLEVFQVDRISVPDLLSCLHLKKKLQQVDLNQIICN